MAQSAENKILLEEFFLFGKIVEMNPHILQRTALEVILKQNLLRRFAAKVFAV